MQFNVEEAIKQYWNAMCVFDTCMCEPTAQKRLAFLAPMNFQLVRAFHASRALKMGTNTHINADPLHTIDVPNALHSSDQCD